MVKHKIGIAERSLKAEMAAFFNVRSVLSLQFNVLLL